MIRVLVAFCLTLAGLACAADGPPLTATDPAAQLLVMVRMPAEHFRIDGHYGAGYGEGASRTVRRKLAAAVAERFGLVLVNDWPMPMLGIICYVMNLTASAASSTERERVLAALEADPRVAWAQPMNLYRAQAHQDPLYPIQQTATSWHLDELHARSTGRRVRVAVVDSGVQQDHPDLAGQIESRQNFVADHADAAERHGTEVAGIIAARADNHLGIVGIAPDARLLALRACWQESERSTLCTSLSLALALEFAIAHDAQVINLSLSGPPDRLLGRLIDVAIGQGIAVVAAADPRLPRGGFPASQAGVLAVADEGSPAVAGDLLFAPGRDIPTSGPPSRWYLVSGASYAAAQVSGLMALLDEPHAALAADGTAVVRRADGSVDACASLARRLGTCACACGAVTGANAPPRPQ